MNSNGLKRIVGGSFDSFVHYLNYTVPKISSCLYDGAWKKIAQISFYFPRKPTVLYVISTTYRTVGVKLVVTARYGARFVVLKHPFGSDYWRGWTLGRELNISARHVILYNAALFSLSPRNSRFLSSSLRVDAPALHYTNLLLSCTVNMMTHCWAYS